MKIKVYHRNDLFSRNSPVSLMLNGSTEFEVSKFTLVAEVDVDIEAKEAESALEDAYRLTNTIHRSWWENDGVIAHVSRTRSTSVGDVLEIDGRVFAVAACGFREIASNQEPVVI